MGRVIAGCEDGNCPKVEEVDGGAFYDVQGDLGHTLGQLPAGEGGVRIPREVALEFARAVMAGEAA